MNIKRLTTLSRILKRDPDLQPTGHWIGKPGRNPADAYLTRDELIDLISVATGVELECQRYGLEDMGGNHADVLLRHVYGSKAATLGAKDATIEIMRRRLVAADALAEEAGARKYHDHNDLQLRVQRYREAK